MKTLKTLAIVNAATNLKNLQKVMTDFGGIEYNTEINAERAIEKMSRNEYDLLIVDKNLKTGDYNKMNKLSDVLFSDAAVVNMNLADEGYLRFKISGLLSKWEEAQTDGGKRYIDGSGD